MKLKRLIASTVAAVLSVTAVAASASAYDFGTQNRLSWDPAVDVPAEEFAELAEKPVITLTFETREMPDGWYGIKPCYDAESGWDFVTDASNQAELTEGKDCYLIQKEQTTMSFTVPEAMIPVIKENGIHFLGYAVNLKTMTLSAAASGDTPTEPAGTDAPAGTEPNAGGDTQTPTGGDKTNADTGVEGVAVVAGLAIISAGAIIVSKKRK